MVAESLLSETYFGSTISQYAVFFAVLTVGAVVGRAFSFVLE
jgi:MscS family membrane protein